MHSSTFFPLKKVPLTNIFKSTSFAKILIEKLHFEVLFGIKHVLKFSIYGLALAFLNFESLQYYDVLRPPNAKDGTLVFYMIIISENPSQGKPPPLKVLFHFKLSYLFDGGLLCTIIPTFYVSFTMKF